MVRQRVVLAADEGEEEDEEEKEEGVASASESLRALSSDAMSPLLP